MGAKPKFDEGELNELFNEVISIESFLNGLYIASDANDKEKVDDVIDSLGKLRGLVLRLM